MKYLYILIFLVFSCHSFSQNILGEWFLHYIEIDGVQQYSTVPNSFNQINFIDDSNFQGTVCSNGYIGQYSIIDNSTLSISSVAAFAGYCNYLTESILFLHPYLFTVLSDSAGLATDTFNYSITGATNDQTLIITNSENNLAVYGRSPLPFNELPGVWYLHSITKNGVPEINTHSPYFQIDISLTPGSFTGIEYMGNAVCNGYSGEYNLAGTDELVILGFTSSLAICDDNDGNIYESSYRSFFNDYDSDPNTTVILNYLISGSGNNETLVLTDSNGDFLTYGRQVLSVTDIDSNNTSISIKENPVKENILLVSNFNEFEDLSYQVFSMEGKLILNGKLHDNKTVNVSGLDSGMYLIRINSAKNYYETLKFVKK